MATRLGSFHGNTASVTELDFVQASAYNMAEEPMNIRFATLAIALFACGCGAVSRPNPTDQADIRNWDFTTCLDDVGTCSNLLLDNQEVILGGHTFIGLLIAGFGADEGNKETETLATDDIDLGFLPPPTPDAPNQADIREWDFSACLEDWEAFGTCSELLTDNAEIILGGRSWVDALVDGWQVLQAEPES